MRELGKNIIFHYEKLKDSDISFDEIDNVKYDFKICYSNELVGNKNNKIINLSNSKYNENIVRFNIGDSIKFPKAYTGYTIIGIHTWNTSKNTQLNLPKDWLQRRKIKVSLKFNSNNQDICLDNIFTDVRIKITDNLTIFIEESKETSVKFSYCDIVSFFLLKNTNDELYFDEKYFKDDIERDKIAIRKKYNCNYLIPPIKFYKEIIDEYCAIMDPRKLKLSQEQVNILSCSDREKYQFDFKYKTAKARIHNRLSYKIGQALIENSKSIWGYIRMPFVLSYIKDKHKLEQKAYKEKIKENPNLALPPLETYPDYDEALREKECFTYKLGEAFIKASKNWYGGGNIIYLDGDEFRDILGAYDYDKQSRINLAIKRSKFAKFLNDQGMIVIITTISMFNEIYKYNRQIFKNYIEVYIKCNMDELIKRDQKGLYTKAINKETQNVVGIDISFDQPQANLTIDNSSQDRIKEKVQMIISQLKERNV
ncbi:adenylyl-sulfate kinase [Campylobacter jejuni]|nr:adenylyl-sulfate kinase [Campylobacter jejuni]